MIATEPRRLRRALTTVVLPLLAVPLAACTSHGTDMVYTPAVGVTERSGEIDVLNALIVSTEEGEGRLVAGLNNSQDEEDTLVQVNGVEEDVAVQSGLFGDDVTIPADGFVQLADTFAVEGTQVLVNGDDVVPGKFIRLELQFRNAEPVEVHVPVVAPEDEFDGILSPFASPSGDAAESPSSPATEESE